MNAGFSSLAVLREAVLPPSMGTRTDFDATIKRHGLAVAEMMESYCGRKFGFEPAAVQTFDAGNVVFSLERYPVAEVTAIELQSTPGGQWQDVMGNLKKADLASGILFFRTPPGQSDGTLRVTYAGGFWWDITEDGTGAMPAGAKALPVQFFNGLAIQVQAIIQSTDLLGTGAAPAGSEEPKKKPLPELELLPGVKGFINPHRRLSA